MTPTEKRAYDITLRSLADLGDSLDRYEALTAGREVRARGEARVIRYDYGLAVYAANSANWQNLQHALERVVRGARAAGKPGRFMALHAVNALRAVRVVRGGFAYARRG